MKTALLLGREHTVLGRITAIAEGPVAVSLSCGGARKVYSHVDPNEDVAGFAFGAGGLLLTVADGHAGHRAAEIAATRLLERYAPAWTGGNALDPDSWPDLATRCVLDLNAAILEDRPATRPSATTLALALIRPQQDLLAFASIGDSHIFQVGTEVVDLAGSLEDGPFFLGFTAETGTSLEDKLAVGGGSLAGLDAIVLATDGLSEQRIGVELPELAVSERAEAAALAAPPLRPLELARGIARCALDAQLRQRSGDNVASAVAWLGARGSAG
jgi:hypothetical protein